ncbi:MAG TPA: glycosyltransferase, partial [Chloroflexota bacterium]|nr:glycosyltransferase [Chloroflexota bacterium]
MSAPPRQPELSIVLPTLNEAENLKELLPELGAILQAMGIGGEVLVVDGGSQDGTQAVADALGARVVPTEPGY